MGRARSQGWSFHHSQAFQEWVIITRDERWKRAVMAKYRFGAGVYTLGEVEAVRGMSEEEMKATHLLFSEFGAEIE